MCIRDREKDLPIDYEWYLEKQIKPPLLRIFEVLVGNPDSIFAGEHTRNKYVAKVGVEGMGKFIKVKEHCLGCKIAIDSGPLCKRCQETREREIYFVKLIELRKSQMDFNELWAQCQRCQGSLHQDILCMNRDCPIFYRRRKVVKDLEGAAKIIAKFENNWT
eukprot:TRINITY_DN0_c4762_g1_i1.p1 TRINITY_DN0_c4762_g1~~TRINITY_DN0_c4762_g1_i1.p1  ORF type:complete len:162 (+),score=36.77 TRINITY_DN0_c4762_g1_i1:2-487(+)